MSETATQTQTEHAPGSFCWIELATTDGPGAKNSMPSFSDGKHRIIQSGRIWSTQC